MLHKEISIFVPIKSVSQRVPNKNYRIFDGAPLWKHTFDKLVNYNVYVDTDDPVLVSTLREEYSNVTSYLREDSMLGHEVSVCNLIKNWVETFDPKGFLFQVHVTSPFLKVKTLEQALSEMTEKNDSVFSCTEYQTRFWHQNKSVNHDPKVLIQTQDLEPLYEENSLFYGFNKETALLGMRIGKSPLLYKTSKIESMDIDIEEDWDACVAQQIRMKSNAEF